MMMMMMMMSYDFMCVTQLCQTEADLGMFSMFGRTGAPQKWGPTTAQKMHFCNMVTSQKY